jgi:hypothetical protein
MTIHYSDMAGFSTRHRPEPARRTAGTLKISADYTNSVRVLRAAVLANRAAGHGVAGERVDDVSCEIIDNQASRRTLRLVAGQLKRACARSNGNGHTD